MTPDDIPTTVTELTYTAPWIELSPGNGFKLSQNDAAKVLAHFWPEIEAHIRTQIAQEPEIAPSPEHAAVYLDDNDNLWADYPTSPPGDAVLPLVWASEECESKGELEARGRKLRVIGWSR